MQALMNYYPQAISSSSSTLLISAFNSSFFFLDSASVTMLTIMNAFLESLAPAGVTFES